MSKGLTNLGNTCYMNSALQCLLHLPELSYQTLINDIQKKSLKNDYQLMDEFNKLYQKMWDEEGGGIINTKSFLIEFMKRCQKDNIYFESFLQNDAQEFITILIDLLNNSIKRSINVQITGTPKNEYDKIKLESIHSWKSFFKNNYSSLIPLFYTKNIAFTVCEECNYTTRNHEPMSNLTLTMDMEYETLYDCLNEYTKKTKLDSNNEWKCDKCEKYVLACKKNIFFSLSPVLIISLKLFRNNKKINKYIHFPEILDMEDYVINIKNQTYQYRLIGICVHTGTLHGGHYYSICRNYKNDQWYIFNDTNVKTTTIEHVLNETPYCLFYEKIN